MKLLTVLFKVVIPDALVVILEALLAMSVSLELMLLALVVMLEALDAMSVSLELMLLALVVILVALVVMLDALVEILVKPKNALIKQYTRLLWYMFSNRNLCGHEGLSCVAMQVSTVWPCRFLLCGHAGFSRVAMQLSTVWPCISLPCGHAGHS